MFHTHYYKTDLVTIQCPNICQIPKLKSIMILSYLPYNPRNKTGGMMKSTSLISLVCLMSEDTTKEKTTASHWKKILPFLHVRDFISWYNYFGPFYRQVLYFDIRWWDVDKMPRGTLQPVKCFHNANSMHAGPLPSRGKRARQQSTSSQRPEPAARLTKQAPMVCTILRGTHKNVGNPMIPIYSKMKFIRWISA